MSTPRRRRKDQTPLTQSVDMPATAPTATRDRPNVVEKRAVEPTHEDIARRAYQLYEDRGGEHGRDREDWFQAERDIRLRDGARENPTEEGRDAKAQLPARLLLPRSA